MATDDLPNGWDPTLADLASRRDAARGMGGPERLAKHDAEGKLDARARIDTLLDAGSFREVGTLVGGEVPSDGFVAGAGSIDGRPVMVGAEDYTTLAGTIATGSNSKRYRIAELAVLNRVPLVMLLEGAGARAGHTVEARAPMDLVMQAQCSGAVPVVTGVLGVAAGHSALIAPISDFTVMTERASIFTAGPPVVKESLGEEVTKQELGGPAVAVSSGLIHNVADDDQGALAMIRRYLSYFPSSAWSYPPSAGPSSATCPRPVPELLDIIPRDNRRIYDMRRVLDVVLDAPDWFEVRPGFGRSIICALGHLGGEPLAVVANQPMVMAGAVSADAADKAAHFVSAANAFHLPIVFLADNPGLLPGAASERAGILRSGARLFAAQSMATSPKLHITLRKAYGFGSIAMALAGFDGQVATFAYPGATLGAMGARALSKAVHADDDTAGQFVQTELEASYRTAERLTFDELIDPRETRDRLIDALHRALATRQAPAAPVARTALTP